MILPQPVARAPAQGAPSLPTGVKPPRRAISSQKLRMLMEDRGIASGGRNTLHRRPTAATR